MSTTDHTPLRGHHTKHVTKSRRRIYAEGIGAVLLILVMLPFILYAIGAGVDGLSGTPQTGNRFHNADGTLSNFAIFGHMIIGGVLTVFAPLQLLSGLRQRWPHLHRWSGRLLCVAAFFTGVGGLFFIAARGTIGGAWMDAGFGLYGFLLIVCALQTLRHARAGRLSHHRRWALRLFVLCLGSWLYRIHYGVWYAVTGGIASTPAFDGAFDIAQNAAFYLPYLLILELWMRHSRART